MRSRFVALAAVVLGLALATSAQAAHHLWVWSEIFSTADGQAQYMELFTSAASEQGVGAFTITSNTHTFNFVTNLPSSATANTWILVATSNFGSFPGGVTPDYIIPASFFATGGGTLNYASGVQIWNYGAVPTDGINALHRDGSTAVNAPHNFAGSSGSVNLAAGVPMMQTWGIFALVGALLLMASGLFRRQPKTA
ncbi:MAG TPA: hypothetical protein VL332_08525 [Candidatus Saccharimonadaceae bacterium]|jgi:hypothetical protein|nr:hypothetical protein [Candidatus Saccharimonadaceae bacterium]